MLENPVTEYNSYCSPYEKIDVNKLSRLYKEHKWILKPIDHASATVLGMPFFTWIKDIESPVDFKQSAQQLYFHSAKFPKVMGLMLGLTPMSENHMMPFYAQHAY
ncbi:MAG: hypothetical protein RPU73_03415, partial [Candidatus Sedimenticola sp. (ex Thyasira tokunagai)]